jgi:hypothetical protein
MGVGLLVRLTEGITMLCYCKEPSLNELMQEPIVRAVMACDAVEESELRDLIERLRLPSAERENRRARTEPEN